MLKIKRYDTVEIKAVKTDEGFILDKPIIGRVGLMTYLNADGSTRIEYRPAEEAFNADSLASIRGKPITNGHVDMANSTNISNLPVLGTVLSSGEQDGDNIRADVSVFNLPNDSRELSCGYTLTLDETAGTYQGQHYDAIQRNIRYNHLAVVNKGRAGVARLNMDGDQFYEDEMLTTKQRKKIPAEEFGLPDTKQYPMPDREHAGNAKARATQQLKAGNLTQAEYDKIVKKANEILSRKDEGEKMDKIRLDNGLEYECSPEVKVFVEQMRKDSAEQKKANETLQAKYDTLETANTKLKEDQEKQAKEQKENFDSAVKSRVEMLALAKQHNIDKADEMQDKDIKIAIIKKVNGDSFNLDGKSDDYITAAFDICKSQVKQNDDTAAKNRQKMNNLDNKDEHIDEDDLEVAEAKLREDEANAYLKEVK